MKPFGNSIFKDFGHGHECMYILFITIFILKVLKLTTDQDNKFR